MPLLRQSGLRANVKLHFLLLVVARFNCLYHFFMGKFYFSNDYKKQAHTLYNLNINPFWTRLASHISLIIWANNPQYRDPPFAGCSAAGSSTDRQTICNSSSGTVHRTVARQ